MNNALDAPKAKIRPPKVAKKFRQDDEDLENMKKLNKISRVKKKTVTINEKPTEFSYSHDPEVYQPPSKNDDQLLDFDNILKSQGINLDTFLKDNEERTNKDKPVFDENNIMELLMMGGIAPEEKKEEIKQELYESNTSENESAPMGAMLDDVEPEEEEEQKLNNQQKKELAFKKSLVDASSASEDERGFQNSKRPGISSDEEVIDTTSRKDKIESMLSGQAYRPPQTSVLSGQAYRPPQTSILSGQGIRPPTDYSKARVKSSGTGEDPVGDDPTLNTTDLVLPFPELPKTEVITKRSEVSSSLTPDSLLFKPNEEREIPVDPYRQRPATSGASKINYRGVWIESGQDNEEEPKDTEDEDRHFFNQQRELMKQNLKKTKNTDFGDVDKFKMQNVGVEVVGDERLIKVQRDWDN